MTCRTPGLTVGTLRSGRDIRVKQARSLGLHLNEDPKVMRVACMSSRSGTPVRRALMAKAGFRLSQSWPSHLNAKATGRIFPGLSTLKDRSNAAKFINPDRFPVNHKV